MKILVLCTGNTCRSQMAEGYLRYLKPHWEIFSAGTEPGTVVSPLAVEVMREIGIDISKQYPQNVNEFVSQSFDYVITVCDDANEKCPVFSGKVKHKIHKGFYDPASAIGTKEEKLRIYRNVRNQIMQFLEELFKNLD